MTRAYTLKRRADRQARTRQKIIEAAVALHTTVGPGRTTISMVAQRAAVQRHTLYAHFPDERSLFVACSGLALERDPLPDATPWRRIKGRRERLRVGLQAIYDWYDRNAQLVAGVLRDAAYHPLTQELVVLHLGPAMADYQKALGASLTANQRAVLQLALSYFTWRTLVRESGLTQGVAVAVMVRAIDRE